MLGKKAVAVVLLSVGALVGSLAMPVVAAPATHSVVGATVAEASPGAVGAMAARIATVVTALIAKYGPRFVAFIKTHVANLLKSGAKTIQQAYKTKAATIAEHQTKLAKAREVAKQNPTQANNGLVRYYEKEISRLQTEHSILRDAMEMMGIPVP